MQNKWVYKCDWCAWCVRDEQLVALQLTLACRLWAFFLFACLTMLLAACNAPLAVTLARSLVLCSSPLISSRRETACSLACTLMTTHLCCILLCVLPYGIVSKERCGGLMVSALDTWSSSLNSRHRQGHCTVFFGKTFTLTVPLLTQAHTNGYL